MANQLDVTNDPRTDEEDLQADIGCRIADIERLRKCINDGMDNAIKELKGAENQERVQMLHKHLLIGIAWTIKEEQDAQLGLMSQ